MTTIHKLTDRLLPGEADEELVEALQDLLDRAKRGEIAGLAWAGCGQGELVFTGWQGAGGTLFPIGAGILALQSRYAEMMMEPD